MEIRESCKEIIRFLVNCNGSTYRELNRLIQVGILSHEEAVLVESHVTMLKINHRLDEMQQQLLSM